jgi:hypothetical protein
MAAKAMEKKTEPAEYKRPGRARGAASVAVYVRLPEPVHSRLVRFQRSIRRPLCWIVREALKEFMDTRKGGG